MYTTSILLRLGLQPYALVPVPTKKLFKKHLRNIILAIFKAWIYVGRHNVKIDNAF
jgi:hypothetical protein